MESFLDISESMYTNLMELWRVSMFINLPVVEFGDTTLFLLSFMSWQYY